MPRRTIIVRIPPDLWRWVGYRSADTGKPKGTLVSEALEAWLESPGEVNSGPVGPTLTTSVNIDADLHARMTAAAAERGVSAAEIVRAAVGRAMAHHPTL